MRFNTTLNILNSVGSIFIATICYIGPLGIGLLIRSNKNALNSTEFQTKYGTLTEFIRTSSVESALYNVIQLVRWQITISVLIFLRDYPIFQVLSLWCLSLLIQLYFLIYRPFTVPSLNRLSLFNEFLPSLYLCAYLLLSDYAYEQYELQDAAAYVLIALVCLSAVVNLVYTSINIVIHIRSEIIKWNQKRRRASKEAAKLASEKVKVEDSKKAGYK